MFETKTGAYICTSVIDADGKDTDECIYECADSYDDWGYLQYI